MSFDGVYYEYTVMRNVFPPELQSILNEWGRGGWRFVSYADRDLILERKL